MVDGIGDPLDVDEVFLQGVMESLPDGPPQGPERAGNLRTRRHLRIVKLLVTMSPLGLLGAGRSMFMGHPGQLSRMLDSITILPVEGRPGLTDSIREILGITMAVAGKLGISTGDLSSVKPVIALGTFVSAAWPLTLALLGTGLVALVLYRPLQKLFIRND